MPHQFMKRRKILVNGGAGYIGSHTLLELLHAGYQPVVVDNHSNSDPSMFETVKELAGTDIPHYNINCSDRDAMARVLSTEKDIFGVIHFAAFKSVAESVAQPMRYYQNNLGALATTLELMEEFGIRHLVFSSSCSVYGNISTPVVTEDMPLGEAKSPYARTKQICEKMIDDTLLSEQVLKAATLRYFNPIGAHASHRIGELSPKAPGNLVPLITRTVAGHHPELLVYGNDYPTKDGTCIRDFIHVCDLARAHVNALKWLEEHPGRQINEKFNIGTGQGHSVLDMIRTFEEITGEKVRFSIGPRRTGDIERIHASVVKANSILGW
ncbi:MAG: UDP-glucose 4-epimerase GalE, partial [Bacteroidota bacterium]